MNRIIAAALIAGLLATASANGGIATNDLCDGAAPISGEGLFFFDNTSAVTDGPPDPACDEFGDPQIANDVWFCWIAPCDAVARISTCDLTTVDTKIAVYDGCVCPPGPPLACNDDDPRCGTQSTITFPTVAGAEYLIRVGTFPGAFGGTGEFQITCELPGPTVDIEITQLTFETLAFSDHGQLHVTVPEPPEGLILWVNATVDGVWAIENAPLIQINGEGHPETYTYDFKITDTPGIPVPSVEVEIEITELQLVSPPVVPIVTIPVDEHIYLPGATVAEPVVSPLPFFPAPATDYINPAAGISWQTVRLSNVPGIAEDRNHCAPGGFARMIAWMNHFWCLGLPDTNSSVQQIYNKLQNSEHMNTSTSGGTRVWARAAGNTVDCNSATWGKLRAGLVKFLTDKGLNGKVSIECNMFKTQDATDPAHTPCDVFEAVKQGKAVVVNWGYWTNNTTVNNSNRSSGHSISIVGASKCGTEVTLFYRDDASGRDSQTDMNADTGVKTAKFKAEGTSGWTLLGNRWEGFVALCPSIDVILDAAVKYTIEELVRADAVQEDFDAGMPPSQQLLDEMVDLATALRDVMCALLARVAALDPPNAEALALTQRLKNKAVNVKLLAEFLRDRPSQNTLDQLQAESNAILMQLEELRPLLVSNCEGDTNDDGAVNVDDLNNVILDWGTDGSANGGDITGSTPGSRPDGVVDVNDLNAVIVNWGECP